MRCFDPVASQGCRGQGEFALARTAVLMMVAWPLLLICWLGYDQVVDRLATLRGGEALQDSRLSMWGRVLPLIRDFPLWGTGDGTYEFVQSLHHATGTLDANMIIDHAHNDYLEILVEGGLAQFIPALLAIVLVWRCGLRAIRRAAGHPIGGLAIGAVMAVATVTIHSFSDFGMHIPACAALVIVLCAYVCGASEAGDADERLPGDRNWALRRVGGLARAVAAGFAVALAPLLAYEGSKAYQAQQLRARAAEQDLSRDSAKFERKVAYSRMRPASPPKIPVFNWIWQTRTSSRLDSGCTSCRKRQDVTVNHRPAQSSRERGPTIPRRNG